jgi:hypothetical protein
MSESEQILFFAFTIACFTARFHPIAALALVIVAVAAAGVVLPSLFFVKCCTFMLIVSLLWHGISAGALLQREEE